MITTTLSPSSEHRKRRGFTLVEVMVSAGLAAFILAAVLSSFLFLGRSGANLRNYTDMETQARKALEQFAEDTRQASAVTWSSSTSVTLVVNSQNVTYSYSSGTFSRTYNGSTSNLLTGITSFTFFAYTITGTQISDFSTAAARVTANNSTKQIQISLAASRSNTTVTTATDIVLSARYILRNKRVTA
jgi:prepilin-type N-terminal cleavage/methylation domain-containing protein